MNLDNMTHRNFLILKIKKTKIFSVAMVVFVMSAFLFNFSLLEARADTIIQETPVAMPQLLDKSVFREDEQTLEMIHPRLTDGSTNIIFFIDNAPQYFAEAIANGDHLLSDYFDPPLSVGKYILVEYSNDGGNFGCSGFSLNDCVTDPHFISQESFEIVDNNAIIPVPTPPTIDIIDSGAIPDNNFVPVTPLPDSTPVVPTPELTPTSTPALTPEPVIQDNGDGSTTIIAI